MHQIVRNKHRPIISLLLVLNLFTVVSSFEPGIAHCLQRNLKPFLYIPSFMEFEIGPAFLTPQANSRSTDKLFTDDLILEQISNDLARASTSFLADTQYRLDQFAGRTQIAIREPPCST